MARGASLESHHRRRWCKMTPASIQRRCAKPAAAPACSPVQHQCITLACAHHYWMHCQRIRCPPSWCCQTALLTCRRSGAARAPTACEPVDVRCRCSTLNSTNPALRAVSAEAGMCSAGVWPVFVSEVMMRYSASQPSHTTVPTSSPSTARRMLPSSSMLSTSTGMLFSCSSWERHSSRAESRRQQAYRPAQGCCFPATVGRGAAAEQTAGDNKPTSRP